MRHNGILKGLIIGLTLAFLASAGSFPAYAGSKNSKSKKTAHKSTGKKKSSKKQTPAVYYVTPPEENLRGAPSGQRIGSLAQGTPVKVTKTKGSWAYVTVKAWIWKPSLSKTRPKMTGELLVKNVDGVFKGKTFIIKGSLINQTKVVFGKVVLQGELFKGKKRVAHKSLTLFSKKKPLAAGKTAPFSISFKRTKGFDSYSVRILTATEK